MRNKFIKYVFMFYGPDQIYGELFKNTLTQEEVAIALGQRIERRKDLPFDGDSVDRELVRDIMLENRAS